MKTHIIYFVVTALFLVGCKNSDYENSKLPYNIDLEKGIDNINSIPLSTLGSKLEYIPLETNPECLVQSIFKISVTDSFIFVADYNLRVLLFNITGKSWKRPADLPALVLIPPEISEVLSLDNITFMIRPPEYVEYGEREGVNFIVKGLIQTKDDLLKINLSNPNDDSMYEPAYNFLRKYKSWVWKKRDL